MIKIFLSVRNRLAITKKCIEAIERHTELPYQLYVYNNQTNYKTKEHWSYFRGLYENKKVTQVTFNTNESTFNAFSKASAWNAFGLQHEMDPRKDKIDFLICLDNDVLVLKKWDLRLKTAWNHINKNKLKNIKIVGSLPGGIKHRVQTIQIVQDKLLGRLGKLGGSGFWSVRPNFFSDVGFLPISQLVGHSKKHDQLTWSMCSRATNGKEYILGLKPKLAIHVGRRCGSTCNRLTRQAHLPEKKKLDGIKFEDQENKIDSVSFDDFYQACINDDRIVREW
jgi:hypothetical protein